MCDFIKKREMTEKKPLPTASTDTIAALCTAPGGALSILRISGPEALKVAEKVWFGSGKNPLSAPENIRKMLLGKALDPANGEPCLAVYMKGPASYTGEDTVELQCHGGSIAPGLLLKAVFHAGARMAEGGEFTLRAFINGKMDLTQAEAVADLIQAKSARSAVLAEKQLSGLLGRKLKEIRTALLDVLSEVESRMDFPEEELDWIPEERLLEKLSASSCAMEKMLATRTRGQILRKGVRVVLAGRPNSGKSSLLNALLGYERAIVTPIEGTTRDTLEEVTSFGGIPVRLTDTAGLREETSDEIEKMGISRSMDSLKEAEVILWVADLSDKESCLNPFGNQEFPENAKVILCWNKCDLAPAAPLFVPEGENAAVQLSAKEGIGVEALVETFKECVLAGGDFSAGECEISSRHGEYLERSLPLLACAGEEIREENWELAASCLRHVLADLGSITGETASPDVLEEIFSRFCIGK